MTVPDWRIPGTMASAERAAILEALHLTSFNMHLTAQRLRIGRTTLYRMVERFEIEVPRKSAEKRRGGEQAGGLPPTRAGVKTVIRLVDGEYVLVQLA